MKEKKLSDKALEQIASRFRILSDPMRLKILHMLNNGEKNVGELVEATGGGQANISKHLGILLDAGIVGRRKEGLNAYYRMADETIFELCEVVCSRLESQLSEQKEALADFRVV